MIGKIHSDAKKAVVKPPTTQVNNAYNARRVNRKPAQPGSGVEILQLQQIVGNRATNRYATQAKLMVGPSGDAHEQEADRVAARVVNGSAAQTQTPEVGRLQTKSINPTAGEGGFAAGAEFENQVARKAGGGQALEPTVQREFAPKFGADFSGVRIHADDESARLNKQIGAKAFTHGNDIHFNTGYYNPGSKAGKSLLAHELTHTLQQGAAQPGAAQHGAATVKRSSLIQRSGSATATNEGTQELPTSPRIAVTAGYENKWGGHASIFLAKQAGDKMDCFKIDLTYRSAAGGAGAEPNANLGSGAESGMAMSGRKTDAKDGRKGKGIEILVDKATKWCNPSRSAQWERTNAQAESGYNEALNFQRNQKKYWYSRLGIGWRGHNCASFAEKILKAAGVKRSAGLIISTPSEVVSGKMGGVTPVKKK